MLDQIGSVFVICAIVTLLFLVVAFLGHAIGLDGQESREPSRNSLVINGVVFAAVAVGWAYMAWSDYDNGSRNWFWIATSGALAIMSLLTAIQFIRQASKAAL